MDVSIFGFMNEEQDIFWAQQLELIYTQFGVFYEIMPNASRSNFEPKFKPGSHDDGIVGSTSTKVEDQVANQMRNFLINQYTTRQATALSNPTQMTDVLSVHSLDQKGNQLLETFTTTMWIETRHI